MAGRALPGTSRPRPGTVLGDVGGKPLVVPTPQPTGPESSTSYRQGSDMGGAYQEAVTNTYNPRTQTWEQTLGPRSYMGGYDAGGGAGTRAAVAPRAAGDSQFRNQLQQDILSGLSDVGSPAAPPPRIAAAAPPSRADSAAAENAAFARAKERIGLNMQGALRALQGRLGRSGMLGSSYASRGMADIVGGGQQQLSETVRDQAIQGLQRAQNVEDRDYAAALSQRGQDIGQREQEISAANAAQQQRLSRLQTLMNLYGAAY